MTKSRAQRRHDAARLKHNRKNYWYNGKSYGREGLSRMSEKQLGQVVQHPQVCSCPMCGNPRKHFGERTIQERRAMQLESHS